MQQTRKLTAASADEAPAIRRSDQPQAVDIREVTARAAGRDRLNEGPPDTYAYRLMKQFSGIKTT